MRIGHNYNVCRQGIMERNYPKITVTGKCEKFLKDGHVWVYDNEVISGGELCRDGEITDVLSERGKWLGAGFYNSNSKIRVRIISRNTNDRFDPSFWHRRVEYAVSYRKTVMGDDFDCCRLIFGEADGISGLTVDKFGTVLVTEVLCLGTDRIKSVIYDALVDVLSAEGCKVTAIYERSNSPIRAKEGLEPYTGYYLKPDTDDGGTVRITENGIKYDVDYINGQKTGFFLDQKYNRLAVSRIAGGKRVLDCCTHTGAFALGAAAGGAASVTAVDISSDALKSAEHNADINDLSDRVEFVRADVFEYLTALAKERRGAFDFIVLDPPAFTKSAATARNAYLGYREINTLALKALSLGGYLATCSCSHFMTEEMFARMLADAARLSDSRLRIIEIRRQSPDHPVLMGVPETLYLKFYLLQKV